jgi:hypothetical protein
MFNAEQIKRLREGADKHGINPTNCPNCEYDRSFPETSGGGWMYMGNNGPIIPCAMCNADEKYPRSYRMIGE